MPRLENCQLHQFCGNCCLVVLNIISRDKHTLEEPVLGRSIAVLSFEDMSSQQALDYLERSFEFRESSVPDMKLNPNFELIRNEHGFETMLKKMGM